MSGSYLLATSLLTGLVIPTPVLTQIPNLPKNSPSLLDLAPSFQSNNSRKSSWGEIAVPEFSSQTEPSAAGGKSISRINTSLPEFSKQTVSPDKKLSEFRQYRLLNPVKSSFNFNSQKPKTKTHISGFKFYYERLASLRIGQIYTRTDDDDNLESSWELDKRPKPTYQDWKSLLTMEAKAISKGQGTNRLGILVGDSLSLWFPKENLPTGKLWLNQGISGDTSQGVFKRLSAFSATRPDVIYLMIGINDLRKGASNKSILLNSGRIIQSLRQSHPTSQIIMQSILPVRSGKIANSRIRYINAQLAVIARQQGVNYLNMHNLFTDTNGNLLPELTTDGLHLSPAGYQVWQFALEQTEYRVAQINNSGSLGN